MSPALRSIAPDPDRYVRAYVSREASDEARREIAMISAGLGTQRVRRWPGLLTLVAILAAVVAAVLI